MATTALTVVTTALRTTGVLEEGEIPGAALGQNALEKLNNMLHAWGIASADTAHVDLALGDTLTVKDAYIMAIEDNLAVILAPDYGRTLPQDVHVRAQQGFARVQAELMEFDDDLKTDDALNSRYYRRHRGVYDIESG